jgi:hypothetical protein
MILTLAVLPLVAVAAERPWFTRIGNGPDFTWRSGASGEFAMPEIIGGGVALLDADGDGDLDLYLVQGEAKDGEGSRLFRNDGGLRFTDVTAEAGDAGLAIYGMGVTTGDYDRDGDPDLLVAGLGGVRLLRNDSTAGSLRFTDVTAAAGLRIEGWCSCPLFYDLDGDGDLDLFVGRYLTWSRGVEPACEGLDGRRDYCSPRSFDSPARSGLYLNRGDGTFVDASLDSGIASAAGTALGVLAADFDGDGRPDLLVANDGMPNHLFLNQGGNPGGIRFRESALAAGCAVDLEGKAKAGMGAAAIDFDDDGDFDILICNLDGESDSLFRNDGGKFLDVTALAGLRGPTRKATRFGVIAADFDQDGRLDLFEAAGRVMRPAAAEGGSDPYAQENLLFRGNANGRFTLVAPAGGTEPPIARTARGAAAGDLDGDGDLDLVVVNRDGPLDLLRNDAAAGKAVRIRVLEARGGDALGAIVRGTVAGRRVPRTVKTGGSYFAASDPAVHFGLGTAAALEDVEVVRPDGRVQKLGDVAAGEFRIVRPG